MDSLSISFSAILTYRSPWAIGYESSKVSCSYCVSSIVVGSAPSPMQRGQVSTVILSALISFEPPHFEQRLPAIGVWFSVPLNSGFGWKPGQSSSLDSPPVHQVRRHLRGPSCQASLWQYTACPSTRCPNLHGWSKEQSASGSWIISTMLFAIFSPIA